MRIITKYFFFICILILLLFIGISLSLAFFIANDAEIDSKTRSDVILVLGARSYIDGKYNPCLKARVEHAVDLYKAHYGPKILVTGGNDKEDNVNQAETMKKIAIEYGVRPQDILLEKMATSTFENFLFSQKIMKKNNLRSVIIVTDPFHIARSGLIAQKLKYNFSASPAINSPCWSPNHYFTKYFLKEPVALILYKMQNKL